MIGLVGNMIFMRFYWNWQCCLNFLLAWLSRREKYRGFTYPPVSEDSAHNDGLQLTDRVAGAIRDRAWKQNSTNYQTFANRVVDLWQVK